MDSNDLKTRGFKSWKKLSKLKEKKGINIPKKPGVYMLKLDKTFGRLVGESDILYIGSAKNLRDMLYDKYIMGQGVEEGKDIDKTIRRIHKYLKNLGYMDKVEVSWMELELSIGPENDLMKEIVALMEEYIEEPDDIIKDLRDILREKLKEKYEKDHHELPPWNRQG